MPSLPMSRARSSRVRGFALLGLGFLALWGFQGQSAFSKAPVEETEASGMTKVIADHALLMSIVSMIICGALAYTEQPQPAAAGPAEKRPDYSTFVMISNILCFASGFVNALAIIDMGMTVSHQTGNTSHTGRLLPAILLLEADAVFTPDVLRCSRTLDLGCVDFFQGRLPSPASSC